jgi:hypothetical protein
VHAKEVMPNAKTVESKSNSRNRRPTTGFHALSGIARGPDKTTVLNTYERIPHA